MNRLCVISVTAMVALLGLSACEHGQSVGDIATLQLIYKGKPVGKQDPAVLLKSQNKGKEGPGISGFYEELFDNADFIQRNREFSGLIGDFMFTRESPNSSKGSGHLSVDVLVKTFGKGGGTLIKQDVYHWEIEVPDTGFEIQTRGDDRDNPFPDSGITFDKDTLRKIWWRGLNFKLQAKGDAIKVKRIFKNNVLIERGGVDSHPTTWHRWYRSTKESCIDFLTKGSVPSNRIELENLNGFYCLGRCEYPMIINTP